MYLAQLITLNGSLCTCMIYTFYLILSGPKITIITHWQHCQEATEYYQVDLLDDANLCVVHSKESYLDATGCHINEENLWRALKSVK